MDKYTSEGAAKTSGERKDQVLEHLEMLISKHIMRQNENTFDENEEAPNVEVVQPQEPQQQLEA